MFTKKENTEEKEGEGERKVTGNHWATKGGNTQALAKKTALQFTPSIVESTGFWPEYIQLGFISHHINITDKHNNGHCCGNVCNGARSGTKGRDATKIMK